MEEDQVANIGLSLSIAWARKSVPFRMRRNEEKDSCTLIRCLGKVKAMWTADTDGPNYAWAARYVTASSGSFDFARLYLPGTVTYVRGVRTRGPM
jgi:hypothetical protein